MIEYTVIKNQIKHFDDGKKIRFKTPPKTAEKGEIEQAYVAKTVDPSGTPLVALFTERKPDGVYIQGHSEKGVMWRLADIAENYEIVVAPVKKEENEKE